MIGPSIPRSGTTSSIHYNGDNKLRYGAEKASCRSPINTQSSQESFIFNAKNKKGFIFNAGYMLPYYYASYDISLQSTRFN